MSQETSLSDLVKSIEHSLEELPKRRTLADKLLAAGADFMMAIAFLALGITASAAADGISNASAFIACFVGVVVLKLWSVVREYESARDELTDNARDIRLAAMIVEQTVEALETRAARIGNDVVTPATASTNT